MPSSKASTAVHQVSRTGEAFSSTILFPQPIMDFTIRFECLDSFKKYIRTCSTRDICAATTSYVCSNLLQTERTAFEVIIVGGKFSYKQSGEILDTRGGPRDTKWIFVLSTSKDLYVGKKSKGTFQHSSFLAGGATLSAGRLEVDDGILKVTIHSPSSRNLFF